MEKPFEPTAIAGRTTYTSDYIKSDADRSVFSGMPQVDAMFGAMVALSAEVWIGRRRIKVLESLLEKHTGVTRTMTENYVPTPAEETAWKAERDAFVSAMYAPFLRPGDMPFDSSIHPDPGTDPARNRKAGS